MIQKNRQHVIVKCNTVYMNISLFIRLHSCSKAHTLYMFRQILKYLITVILTSECTLLWKLLCYANKVLLFCFVFLLSRFFSPSIFPFSFISLFSSHLSFLRLTQFQVLSYWYLFFKQSQQFSVLSLALFSSPLSLWAMWFWISINFSVRDSVIAVQRLINFA